MEVRHCHSCGMPLDASNTSTPESTFCSWCVTPEGALKPHEEIQKSIADWMKMWQPGVDDATALTRAGAYMKGMPAWAD